MSDSNPTATDARSGLPHEEIRAQLDRILGHREFEATERMRDFLRFVVDETLAGRAKQLKGYTIATQVFGRGKDFDASVDPIVRIQAGRLRRALERYHLIAGGRDPIRIDIPKGRYIPTFSRQRASRTRASDTAKLEDEETLVPSGPTIGILPLSNLTGDPQQQYFVNGLVEEMVTEVNRYREVIAVPCQEVVSAGGYDVNLREVSREVAVRFLLGGSVRRDASSVKVSVQLTDSRTGQQIWSDSYKVDLEAAGLIATEEDIARNVIAAIADEFGIIARRLSKESRTKPPAELSSYDALLRYHHYMLVMTPTAGEQAFAALQQATEREPEYGSAWSALANLYAHVYVFDRPGIESPLEIATEYALRGAALEPANQLTRTILAWIYLLNDEYDLCLGEADAALALNPHSPNYSGTIGYVLTLYGEFERGRALLEEAIALNPCHPRWFHHGLFVYHLKRGEYEMAYKEAVEVGFLIGWWDPAMRMAILGKLGRTSEASASARQLLELKPDFERRIRELLPRTVKSADVREDFLDGLRKAGMRID